MLAVEGDDGQGEKSGARSQKDQGSLYHDISPQQPAWEATMRIRKLEVFDLGGPMSEPTTMEKEEEADRNREKAALRLQSNKGGGGAVQKLTEPLVGEAELRRRIEGSGSDGA